MKKRIFLELVLVLVLVLTIFLTACTSDKQKNKEMDGGVHMNHITGKVIEIKEDNRVLIEITKERGGYKIDDRVVLVYDKYLVYDTESPDAESEEIIPSIGDEVSAQFWDTDVTHNEDYDYIKVIEAALYATK